MSHFRLSQLQLLSGNDYGGNFTLTNGQMGAQRFIPKPGVDVKGIIVRQISAASGCNFDVMLCPDSAGVPDTANPLATVSAVAASGGGGMTHNIDFTTPVSLTFPNRHWIVIKNNTSVSLPIMYWRNASNHQEGVSLTVRQYTTSWQTATTNRDGMLIKYVDDTYQGACITSAGASLYSFHTSSSNYSEFGVEVICPPTHGFNVKGLVLTSTNYGTQPDITPKIYINRTLHHTGPTMAAAAISGNNNNYFHFGKTITLPPDSNCQLMLASPDNIGANGIRVYGVDFADSSIASVRKHHGTDFMRLIQKTQSGWSVRSGSLIYLDVILDGRNPFVFPDLNRRQFNSVR